MTRSPILPRAPDVVAGFERWVCDTCRSMRLCTAPCCKGWLVRARVFATGEERYVCEECETVVDLAPAPAGPVTNLDARLRAAGVEPL